MWRNGYYVYTAFICDWMSFYFVYLTQEELDGGVIPGARHIPFEDLFNTDGTFKCEAEIKTSKYTGGYWINLNFNFWVFYCRIMHGSSSNAQ